MFALLVGAKSERHASVLLGTDSRSPVDPLLSDVGVCRTAAELPEGWACCVKTGVDGRFVVQYVSKDGSCIKSKRQLRVYLEDRGVTGSSADQIVQKAEFSQKYARKFILLNSSSKREEGDTSKDELIALAMQASYNRELGVDDDDDDDEEDPDYDSSGESVGSDSVGEVAAGGWRRRQSELEQETAEDYDVSCLEIKKLTNDDLAEGSCPVCQGDWEAGDEVRVLPCEHQFHTSCIDQWLRKHKANCPLCKKDVREDWEDEEEEVWVYFFSLSVFLSLCLFLSLRLCSLSLSLSLSLALSLRISLSLKTPLLRMHLVD